MAPTRFNTTTAPRIEGIVGAIIHYALVPIDHVSHSLNTFLNPCSHIESLTGRNELWPLHLVRDSPNFLYCLLLISQTCTDKKYSITNHPLSIKVHFKLVFTINSWFNYYTSLPKELLRCLKSRMSECITTSGRDDYQANVYQECS